MRGGRRVGGKSQGARKTHICGRETLFVGNSSPEANRRGVVEKIVIFRGVGPWRN